MDGVAVGEAAWRTGASGPDLLPAEADLSGVELELGQQRPRPSAEGRARPCATAAYGYVLIDCPPSLDVLTINAMTAADGVLVPLQCEFFALEGLTQLLRTVELVRARSIPRSRFRA